MPSLCKAIIVGNLGADPEKRFTQDGRAVTRFRVAVNSRRKEQSGEWADHTEWFGVTAVESKTGAIVGDIAVFMTANGKTAELGYTLHPWARGKGYATEAAARMIEHLVADVGVHRIEASTHPRNVASNRVLERLGFTLEGVKRESYWLGDAVSDDAMWGLLAREWRARDEL